LENGQFDKIMGKCKPNPIFYEAIMDHIERVGCKYPYYRWDINGPKYIVRDGNLIFVGKFKDNVEDHFFWKKKEIVSFIEKHSSLPEIYLRRSISWKRTHNDIDLFVKIISKSNEIIRANYGAEFYVVLWNDPKDKDVPYVVKELINNKINVTLASDILPNYLTDPNQYVIPGDNHPKAETHKLIAQYLLNYLSEHETKN